MTTRSQSPTNPSSASPRRPQGPLSAATLLWAWETGRDRHPIDRALVFQALAAPEADPDELADLSIGQRNEALLRLRLAAFGPDVRADWDCPHCGERLEIDVDARALLAATPRDTAPVNVDGLSFRPPTSRDLADILRERDGANGALCLLRLCLLDSERAIDDAGLEPLIDAVETALERADPLADVTLEARCESCGRTGSAPFDIAGFLWEEVEAFARRLLDEVPVLARAYGWTEDTILGLSAARRTAYLERVLA